MIRCVGAALRGDGNPPEVPMASENIGEVRTALRAYNGVWGIPIKHMSHHPKGYSATHCAR